MRTDIQALRGIAVLLVVFYHFQFGPFIAGYLGVDIFFVISGFLITSLIVRGIDAGTFSLADFYLRRAKRLLPVAFVVLLATTLACLVILAPSELSAYWWQLIGALTFTANFVLLRQSDYFASGSEIKPLLHMWSLSIEEQYYMLLPILLIMLKPQHWRRAVVMLTIASLILCLVLARSKPVAAFYLLPTRAWELLLGSVGALWLREAPSKMISTTHPAFMGKLIDTGALQLVVLAGLLLIPTVKLSNSAGVHPGMAAATVCLCTLVLLMNPSNRLSQSASVRALAYVGDFSYSLYLVHWPVVALINNAWTGPAGEIAPGIRAIAVAASMASAWLLFHLVENPFRHTVIVSPRRFALIAISFSATLVAVVPLAIRILPPSVDYAQARRINPGLDKRCEQTSDVFRPVPECTVPSRQGPPQMLLWGDSYAMHLAPGLAEVWRDRGFVQATRSSCGPTTRMAPMARRGDRLEAAGAYSRSWAESCVAFNSSVLQYLKSNSAIHTVVMSTLMTQYVDGDSYVGLHRVENGFDVLPANVEHATLALLETAHDVRAMGRRVVLVAPPPSADFDVGACVERRAGNRLSFGIGNDCSIPFDEYLRRKAPHRAVIARLRQGGLEVIDLADGLCRDGRCTTMLDNVLLYRDAGHLSIDGSRRLAHDMDWERLIVDEAR